MEGPIEQYVGGHEIFFHANESQIRLYFIGRVTVANLWALAERLYNDPAYNQNWDVLINMGSAKFDITYPELFNYANVISKDPRRILGATALVSPSLVHFGIGRMYQGIVGDRLGKLRIERTEEPALAWLKEQREILKG